MEPAMYLCETDIQGNIKGTQELTNFSYPKIISHTNRSKTNKRKPISSGCAQFNGLIEHSNGFTKETFCEIRISAGSAPTLQRFQASDIFSHSKSVKDSLAKHGVCFIDNKGFKMWCTDIARHFNNRNITIIEHSGYYKENSIWHCTEINKQDHSASETTAAINSFMHDLTTLQTDAFEKLTLILCGLIEKIFTVLKQEKISNLANIILISPDTYKAENNLKFFFDTADNELFNDSSKSLKALVSCINTVPIVTLSDKLPQNKYALDNIVKAKNLNCFPLIIAENKDNITQINSVKHFLIIKYNCISYSDISIIIEAFRHHLLSKDDIITQINNYMSLYLQLFSKGDAQIMFKSQNLYALMLSLIQIILPDFKVNDVQSICDHYFEYLTIGDSVQSIDIDKLKYLLTSDTDYKRYDKKSAEKLEDNTLYYSKKTIALKGLTLSNIAKKI